MLEDRKKREKERRREGGGWQEQDTKLGRLDVGLGREEKGKSKRMETRNVQRLGRKRKAFIALVFLHMMERQKEKGGGGEQKNSTTDGSQTSCCCDDFRR